MILGKQKLNTSIGIFIKNTFFITVAFFLIISTNIKAQTYLGNFTSYSIQGRTVRIFADTSSIKFIFYKPDILRVDFLPSLSTKLDTSFVVIRDTTEFVNFNVIEKDSSVEIISDSIKVICQKYPLRISYYTFSGKLILNEPQEGGLETINFERNINFSFSAGTHFYGTGERGTSLDKNGQSFGSYNTQIGGYNSPLPTMNINVPFLVSNKEFAIYFEDTYPGSFDLGKENPDKFSYTANGGELSYYLIVSATIQGQLEKYTWLTGRQPLPPRWALGYIQSKYGYQNESEARQMIKTMRQKKFPCDAIVLDLYWFKHMGDISWDLSNWPNPFQMMTDFLTEGIKTIVITEPYITQNSINFSEALSNGYLGKDRVGNNYLLDNWWSCGGCQAGLIDFTNPDAQKWWWNKHPSFFGNELAGIWTDLGEPERHPTDMFHYLGSSNKIHNIYDLLWAKTIFNGFNKFRPDERIFNLTRSGYAGIQRYGVIPWSGDVAASFGGLAVQLPMMLNMGMSGLAYHNSDIGGFAGSTTPELYARWMEYGTFCPIARAHGNHKPTEPWGYGTATESIAVEFIKLRYQLLPYIYTMAYKNYSSGLPIARPLFFDYPQDNTLWNNSSEYLWGDNFLVAPVVKSNVTLKNVYLPQGEWIDYWTDKKYTGSQNYTVSAPLDKMPIFVKSGSIIPMQPVMNYSNEYPLDTLILDIYPSAVKTSKFTLYEDDGRTLEYQKGSFSLTNFSSNISSTDSSKNLSISISRTTGNYRGKPLFRTFIAKIHGVGSTPVSVLKNSIKINNKISYSDLRKNKEGYNYDPSHKILYIQVYTVPDSAYNIETTGYLTSVSQNQNLNEINFHLFQNYPNPFNPVTSIDYDISKKGFATLKVYNSLGEEITTLVSEEKNPGIYQVKFDGTKYSSGVYYYRLSVIYSEGSTIKNFSSTKKFILMK